MPVFGDPPPNAGLPEVLQWAHRFARGVGYFLSRLVEVSPALRASLLGAFLSGLLGEPETQEALAEEV